MTTRSAAPNPDPLHDVRGRLAGVLDALDPEQVPQAVTLVALALDELVDPATPPAPWQTTPPGDVSRALAGIYGELGALIRRAGSPQLALAAGQAARYVDEARLALAATTGGAR